MRVLQWAKVAAYCAVTFVLVAAGLLLLELRRDVRQTTQDLSETQRVLRYEVSQVRQSVQAVQQDIHSTSEDLATTQLLARKKLDETSRQFNALLIHADLAATEAQAASIEQRAYLKQMSEQTVTILGNVNTVVRDVDSLVASKEIKETLRHIEATSASTAETSKNVAATSAHIERKIDELTKPAKGFKKVLGQIKDWGNIIVRLIPIF